MCRVCMVFIYLFGRVEARRGCWVSCSIHSPLSPLRQGLKGFVISLLFNDGVGLQTFLPACVAGR